MLAGRLNVAQAAFEASIFVQRRAATGVEHSRAHLFADGGNLRAREAHGGALFERYGASFRFVPQFLYAVE